MISILRLSIAAITFGSSGSAIAQRLGQASDSGPPMWRVALALIICLGLAVAGAFALRWRLRGGGPALPIVGQRRMTVIERTRLPHQVDLCLVRCDGREFLITVSPRDTQFGPEIVSAAPEGAADAS